MTQKTAFGLFVEEGRPRLLESGRTQIGGQVEAFKILFEEWKVLPQLEKDEYALRAIIFNEARRSETKVGPRRQLALLLGTPPSPMETQRMLNRQFVFDLFKAENWRTHPIVVCAFTLYFPPGDGKIYLPAEIGLTTFSIEKGVTDNYGRIIDPVDVPLGYGMQMAKSVEVLRIPYPGMNETEFADLHGLMLNVERFLKKHRGRFGTNELNVFALDSDFELVTRCLEWLNSKSEYTCNFRVLSLSLFAHLASGQPAIIPMEVTCEALSRAKRNPFWPTVEFQLVPTNGTVSAHRQVGKPLNHCFRYSAAYPLTKNGVFLTEKEVAVIIQSSSNYSYYEELCCVYHGRIRDGLTTCALNMSNRYAYIILEILTVSNEVEIIPGGHFPQIYEPVVEWRRRVGWLAQWGITDFETRLRDPRGVRIPVRERRARSLSPDMVKSVPRNNGETRDRGREKTKRGVGDAAGGDQNQLPPDMVKFVPRNKGEKLDKTKRVGEAAGASGRDQKTPKSDSAHSDKNGNGKRFAQPRSVGTPTRVFTSRLKVKATKPNRSDEGDW